MRLACKRHLDDLSRRAETGYWFDEAAAARAFAFFEDYLCHSKGEWARQLFKLSDWQAFIVGSLFGWKRADGLRRFRQAYIEIPRKNGKSTLLAGVATYMLIADGEEGAEVYSAATTRDQAKIVWSEAKNMAMNSPALKSRMKFFSANMNVPSIGAKFEPLAADSDTLDGLNIHCAVVDELHAHKTRDLWDVIDTATGARREPLVVGISTAGKKRMGICWDEHDYTERLLKGLIQDDTHFGIIYTIDEDDDWRSPSAWQKANPNYGVSVKPDDLSRKLAKAANSPGNQRGFKRLHLNMWIEGDAAHFDLDAWDASTYDIPLSSLKGRRCFGGLDLASTKDLSAYALVFPPESEEEPWIVLVWFWMPRGNLLDRVRNDQVKYDEWVDAGLIFATEGDIIDYASIRRHILSTCETYDVQEVAYDRFNATQLVTELMAEDVDMVPYGQGMLSMAPPMRELDGLITGARIAHFGNPVLRWMIGNTVAVSDDHENHKPSKAKSAEKIDGVVAMLMAMGRALVPREADQRTVVYRRGDMYGGAANAQAETQGG